MTSPITYHWPCGQVRSQSSTLRLASYSYWACTRTWFISQLTLVRLILVLGYARRGFIFKEKHCLIVMNIPYKHSEHSELPVLLSSCDNGYVYLSVNGMVGKTSASKLFLRLFFGILSWIMYMWSSDIGKNALSMPWETSHYRSLSWSYNYTRYIRKPETGYILWLELANADDRGKILNYTSNNEVHRHMSI